VAAVPAARQDFAYISSGTWSLVGLELTAPLTTPQSGQANFTNELGVFGTIRYLKNVMGLWLLTECQRAWREHQLEANLERLLAGAGQCLPAPHLIDPDSDQFLAPGNMPDRIRTAIKQAGGRPPDHPHQLVRCIMDSLAAAYAKTIRQAQDLTGRPVSAVHVVGGGCQNRPLCQATADATGLPVTAGPVEASVIGNALLQASAIGAVKADLPALRSLVAANFPQETFTPAEASAQLELTLRS
jgi:rhamnulokinase